jgi:hypothetical protein
MIQAKVSIIGLNELRKKLQLLPELSQQAIKKGVDRTALAIESDAKRKITADGHIITSRLRSSIHAELKVNKMFKYSDNKGQTFDGSLEEDFNDKMEAVAGTNVHYAPYIEFGTKHFRGDSFLNWAALKQQKLLRQRIEDELQKLFNKMTK